SCSTSTRPRTCRRSSIASRRPTSATTSYRLPTVRRCTTAPWSDAPRQASWRCRGREDPGRVACRRCRCNRDGDRHSLRAARTAGDAYFLFDRSVRRAWTPAATDARQRSAVSTLDAARRGAAGVRRCLAAARGSALLPACGVQSSGARTCGAVELFRRAAHRRLDDNDAARPADVWAEHAQCRRQVATDRTRDAAGDVLLETRAVGSARQPDALRRQHPGRRRRESHLLRQARRAARHRRITGAGADSAIARAAGTVRARGDELRSARQRLFARWIEQHPRAADSAQHVAMPLQFGSMRDLPFGAPHFTNYVLERDAGHAVRTTLDSRLQSLVERVLANYIRERNSTGIHNATALLVDYRDMSVRAMIGSADFNSAAIDGQVNGTLAKRSPGSALKPFIYALAMDQGLIHPQTVLKDAPTSFGPYSPENFDGRFVGPITATAAVTRSRNVPAVALSAQLTQPSLYDFLKVAGVSHLASERHYGLVLTLGGGEVTPEEIATLYAMLANRGRLGPLRYLADERYEPGPRLLSEEVSFMTLDMLRSAPRPDDAFAQRRSNIPVAWKTGTSWGFRDAWTAGVFGPYVLVVWVGNFDGSGNPAFVGVQAAAPLFFRIVDAIGATRKLVEPAYRQPPRLEHVDVCSASGDLPNAECPQTTSTWYIPGVSPIRVSQVHRRVWIDTRTGTQACPPYDPQYTRSEVFEYWPTELLQLFAQAGMPRR